jgi:uncharacterized membrane protein HdeD (DUF308 family)
MAVTVILAAGWSALLIRGLVAVALGILAWLWHDISLAAITMVFFGYAMIDGLLSLGGAITAAQSHQRWLSLLLEALVSIAAALVAVAWPGVLIFRLIYIIAAWGLVTGTLQIVSGIELRKYVAGEWLLILSGIASIGLGLIMAVFPLAGPSDVALWLGTYALVFGALLIVLSLRLRRALPLHGAPTLRPVS